MTPITPRQETVWDVCKRRRQCRYGLQGVQARLIDEKRVYAIEGTGWNKNGVLELDLHLGPEPMEEPARKNLHRMACSISNHRPQQNSW